MLSKSRSIMKRLIFTVLTVEMFAAVSLIGVVTLHERKVQYKALDANLRGIAQLLLGAVVDAEDTGDNVLLDLRGITLPRNSVFRAEDERGRVLGTAGQLPEENMQPDHFLTAKLDGKSYRFFRLDGVRIVDPADHGGIRHQITVVYGLPDQHVWHEVGEAVQFFSLASVGLLSLTTVLLIWLTRKSMKPIRLLAEAAEAITVADWNFSPPGEAQEVEELRPLVSALEQAMSRLHQSFEQQKRFTSDAAHELKTNLAIVKSSFQLLSMKPRSADEYEKGFATIRADIARLEEAVLQMLTLARLEQAVVEVEGACRADEALERAIRQSEATAAVKSVQLRLLAHMPAMIRCDARDAELLCSNLLMNAIQYAPEHSLVEVRCVAKHGMWKMTVKDNGPGVADADVPFLFEPFYRGDPSRSRKSGGTGLGLSICKAICERAGGTIAIANDVQGGALVTVELPVL